MELKGNKFVVTGGAGLIGSFVIDHLLAAGAGEILVIDTLIRGSLDNLESALKDPRVSLHKVDIRNPRDITPYFAGAAGCFHLATLRITQCAAEPRHALEVMIDGTFNVLEACVEKKVGKVVFSSTASVYGMADEFPTTERHHPWNNNTWYGASKVGCEGMLRSFKDMFNLDYVTLRYFNVYGPRMDIHGKYTEVLIRWMECLERGERPKIFGDGKQTMDFIYVEDIAEANLLAMASEITDDVFNIASGREISLRDLLTALEQVYGVHVEPEFLPARAVNPVPRRLADVRKAREKFGFIARTGIEGGLNKLVRWRKQEITKS